MAGEIWLVLDVTMAIGVLGGRVDAWGLFPVTGHPSGKQAETVRLGRTPVNERLNSAVGRNEANGPVRGSACQRPQRSDQIFSPIMQLTRGSLSATCITGRSGVRPATSIRSL